MRNFSKLFTSKIHKEITIVKNLITLKYDVKITFNVSKSIVLFEGSCNTFQINYQSGHRSLDSLCFHAEIKPHDEIRILIKGEFQIRTFVEYDEIQKYVLEKLGTMYNE